MIIKEKLNNLSQHEQYNSINDSLKTILLQSVGQEAVDVISKEQLSTKENTVINSTYKTLIHSIQKDFSLDSITPTVEKSTFTKELDDSFVKEARVILVQEIQRQAEHAQIMALPTSMDKHAALLKTTGLLKKNFNLADEDLNPSRKLKM